MDMWVVSYLKTTFKQYTLVKTGEYSNLLMFSSLVSLLEALNIFMFSFILWQTQKASIHLCEKTSLRPRQKLESQCDFC